MAGGGWLAVAPPREAFSALRSHACACGVRGGDLAREPRKRADRGAAPSRVAPRCTAGPRERTAAAVLDTGAPLGSAGSWRALMGQRRSAARNGRPAPRLRTRR